VARLTVRDRHARERLVQIRAHASPESHWARTSRAALVQAVNATRRLYAHGQFLGCLLREFRWPLGVFVALVLGGGFLLHVGYHKTALTYPAACYAAFMMVFFQQTVEFPSEWYLQPIFFLVPLVGLAAVVNSIVSLGYLVITRKQKLQEWHIMNASLVRDHIVVVGVGKLGYRIVKDLLAAREDVVGVDRRLDSPLIQELLGDGATIVSGDARLRKTLEQAGMERARAALLVTDDDLANLDAALTARLINPRIRVVVRLFDDTLAAKVSAAFEVSAISSSLTAAPAFVAAAIERSPYHALQVDGETVHVTELVLEPGSRLAGQRVQEVERKLGIDIAFHKRGDAIGVPPTPDLVLHDADRLLVVAPLERLAALEQESRAATGAGPP